MYVKQVKLNKNYNGTCNSVINNYVSNCIFNMVTAI